MKVIKVDIDPNVRRETNDELRRTIQTAIKAQEFERGRRIGFDEGFEAGVQVGISRAVEGLYSVINDYVKGNRS